MEIRDPIHGFIDLDEWERDIIDHPVFQRLRRIRQLAWTDMVYPGACHTRFEHSLGVMHVATKLFDRIVKDDECRKILKNRLSYNDNGLATARVKVRLASLLHDVGHPPFSHSGDGIFPINEETKKRYKHEEYSAAIIEHLMKNVIDDSPYNRNHRITAEEIANFIRGRASGHLGGELFWREILSSQLDADRADYLLRDAHHVGVAYGRFDLDRLIYTIAIGEETGEDVETGSPRLAIDESGMHVAESLILARYMMFTQVYFQHTRKAFDHHIKSAISHMLANTQAQLDISDKYCFPPPTSESNIKKYLQWTDWKVLGMLDSGGGGPHGELLRKRRHHRCVWETPDSPTASDLAELDEKRSALGGLVAFIDDSQVDMYKLEQGTDILIKKSSSSGEYVLTPLSEESSVVRALTQPFQKMRIYVSLADKEKAIKIIEDLGSGKEGKK